MTDISKTLVLCHSTISEGHLRLLIRQRPKIKEYLPWTMNLLAANSLRALGVCGSNRCRNLAVSVSVSTSTSNYVPIGRQPSTSRMKQPEWDAPRTDSGPALDFRAIAGILHLSLCRPSKASSRVCSKGASLDAVPFWSCQGWPIYSFLIKACDHLNLGIWSIFPLFLIFGGREERTNHKGPEIRLSGRALYMWGPGFTRRRRQKWWRRWWRSSRRWRRKRREKIYSYLLMFSFESFETCKTKILLSLCVFRRPLFCSIVRLLK